jgi:hypothetical protein
VMDYEAQSTGGTIRSIERAASRTRYTASTQNPTQAIEATPRLKAALEAFAPSQDFYIDWLRHESPAPAIHPEGYLFRLEIDASSLPRHKMNLIFATCGQADALIEKGYRVEAKRLLSEALMLEPQANILVERLKAPP